MVKEPLEMLTFAKYRGLRVSKFGRITIPVSVRKTLKLNPGDSVAFYKSGNDVVMRKFKPKQKPKPVTKRKRKKEEVVIEF